MNPNPNPNPTPTPTPTPNPNPNPTQVVSALSAKARGEEVGLLLPLFSAVLAAMGLAVVGYGLMLAPAPQQEEPGNPSANS